MSTQFSAEHDDYDDDPPEPIYDDPEFPRGTTVKVDDYGGVAWRVRQIDHDGMVVCWMVGDDRPFRFDRSDLTLLAREDYCGECGQIGCGHDGYDRS